MTKKNFTSAVLTASAIATMLALAACGGGGGSSSTTSSPPPPVTNTQTATSANVTTPQYAAGSAQLAAFTLLNQERQQCGFATLTENATLDAAAQAHATYMGDNGGLITDTEVSGSTGFSGVTYADRAQNLGYPSSVFVSGVSGGYFTNATLTPTQYGQQLVYGWLSGVYHIAIGVWPINEVGVGWNQTTSSGFPEIQASLSISNLLPGSGNGPLTFPCQGTTGVAYSSNGETPTPPNTSGNWGTPIAVAGLNQTDTIVLQSGTITPTSGGTVITLQVLDSANDPNKLLPTFEGVAYPATPLSPNTTYSVTINGTDNGTAFSRDFTFTTGNVVG